MTKSQDWIRFHPTLLLAQLVLIGFGLIAISAARPMTCPNN